MVQARGEHLDELLQLQRVLVQVELDGAVEQLLVADLLDHVQELLVLEGGGRVLDHDARRLVRVAALHEQEGGLPPVAPLLAGAQQLGHVAALPVDAAVLHQLVRLVLGVEHAQLGEDAGVRLLQAHALLQQADELLPVAVPLVVVDELLQVVGRHDDVQAADLGQLELGGGHAGGVDLLPGAHAVGLARRVDGGAEVAQLDVAGGQLGVVADAVEQDAGRLVQLLVEAPVAHRLDLGHVGRRHKLLQLRQHLHLGVRVHQLRVHLGLLELGARHLQVLDQLLKGARLVGRVDHLREHGRVVRLEVGGDGLRHHARAQLRARQLAPHVRHVHALRELKRAGQVCDVVDQHLHRLHVVVELAVDGERLLVQPVLVAHRDLGDLGAVKVVQPVHKVHHLAGRRLDGGEDEQVLQVLVVRKVAALQHQPLQQPDQLVRQVGRHERLHRQRHLVRVLALRQRRAHHLLHHLRLELVLVRQHPRPQLQVLPLHQVPRLVLEQRVAVGDLDQLVVARAPRAPVRQVRQVRVQLLAKLAHHLAVVELVVQQERLRVLVERDVDLAQRVVRRRLRVALRHARLQPRLQHAQPVAPLHLLHQRLHRARAAHRVQQPAHELLLRVQVQQLAHHLGRLVGRHLLHVHRHVARHVVAEQVLGQLLHKVEPVAHVDQRPRVLEPAIDQQLLHLRRVEVVRVAAHALHLLELAHLDGRLNVLVVHRRVLAHVHDGAQEEVERLVVNVLLEQLDQPLHAQPLRLLRRDVHHQLQVAARVALQQRAQALQRRALLQLLEEAQQELGLHRVRLHHHPLDVVDVRVVLQRPVVQLRPLAQLRHRQAVVVREHARRQDRVRHLRRAAQQVDLQCPRLQRPVLLPVPRQRVHQERRRLLHPVELHEHVHRLRHVDQGAALVLGQLLGKLLRRLGVLPHHVAQDERVVRAVPRLLGVRDDLAVLARLHEAVDHLLRRLRAQVDGQRHLGVVRGHHVAQLLAALQLVLLQPLDQQLRAPLRQHRLGQLHALVPVQRARLQQHREELHQRQRLTRLLRQLLEPLDRVRRAQHALGRLRCQLRRALHVALRQQLVELRRVQLLRAAQVQPPRQLQRQRVVTQRVHHERHQLGLVQRHAQHLARARRHAQHPVRTRARARHEHRLRAQTLAVDGRARVQVEHEQQTHLRDHVHDVVRRVAVHRDRHVRRSLRRERDGLRRQLERRAVRAAHLHDVQLVRAARLALRERKHVRSSLAGTHLGTREATRAALQRLRHALLHRVQLHAPLQTRRAAKDASQQQPLAVRGGLVVDDLLALRHRRVTIEHLLRRRVAVHRPVEHRLVRHQRDHLGRDPRPVLDVLALRHRVRLQLALHLDVEDLQVATGSNRDHARHGVHHRRLRAHGQPLHVVAGHHVHDRQLVLAPGRLAHADELVRLHGHEAEPNVLRGHPQAREVEHLTEVDRDVGCGHDAAAERL
mmetsp:Transcript_3295/g.10326  ORF Transcript_3295/g.10326 Transcript_3295/m.10326 type:complete len:1450 (+) Transcript_3295:864-5213(+)